MINMPGFLLFTLILMRMSGFILLNPVLGRRNLSAPVKAGIIMALSVFLFTYTASRGPEVDIGSSLEYGILLLKEFAVGYVLGFVMSLFFYVPAYAGGMIDFYMGMSMANVYDPQNNSSMPLTGSVFNAMMIMMFFVVDGHLALLKIMIESEQLVPYTQILLDAQAIDMLLKIFADCTILAVKLAFPFFALELLGEVGVGILMKVIPQINVFVVNIEVKVVIGNLLLLLLCAPVSLFLSDLVDQMVRAVSRIVAFL